MTNLEWKYTVFVFVVLHNCDNVEIISNESDKGDGDFDVNMDNPWTVHLDLVEDSS